MSDAIEAKLAELGLTLPAAAAPVAAYVPVVVAGGLAHVSGQLPFIDGKLVTGRLGDDVTTEQGYDAARACGLMLLAQLKAGASVTREELLSFYKGRIAHWQTPDDVVFVDELPHTATGKLSKLTLRGKYKDWLIRKG